MISHWRDPSTSEVRLQKVLVMGVATNPAGRRMFEDTFSSALIKRKIQAVASYQAFPEASEITKERVEAYALEQGFTQILVARIVDKQTVQEYVPPTVTTAYSPAYPGYYGGWYPYYSTSYTTMVTPGYSYERTFVTVETNVYDVKAAKLMWNGDEMAPKMAAAVDGRKPHTFSPLTARWSELSQWDRKVYSFSLKWFLSQSWDQQVRSAPEMLLCIKRAGIPR